MLRRARIDPVPADPARAADETVLGPVRDLEGELARARDREGLGVPERPTSPPRTAR